MLFITHLTNFKNGRRCDSCGIIQTKITDANGEDKLKYSIDYIRVSYQYFDTLGANLFFILCMKDEKIIALFPFQRKYIGPLNLYKKIGNDYIIILEEEINYIEPLVVSTS